MLSETHPKVTFDDPTTGLAAFGNVTFSNAIATTSTGTVGPKNADLVDIQDEEGEFLTVSSVEGGYVVVEFDVRK